MPAEREAPSGLVTFLFTDIEGSTPLLEFGDLDTHTRLCSD